MTKTWTIFVFILVLLGGGLWAAGSVANCSTVTERTATLNELLGDR